MFHEVTDLHLHDEEDGVALAFPGPRRVNVTDDLEGLLVRCRTFAKDDFMVAFKGHCFRGRRESRAVDGTWYRLRKMPREPISLDDLPTPLPRVLLQMMLSTRLSEGGLVYIIGAPGQGKTTTASALVVSRLRKYGGFAYTVEDPPEMPLNGWHGEGYCAQTWVAGEHEADWTESFRGVLRSQPAGTPTMLFVGEVRDPASAQAMLRAATNGFLVVATGFGTDIPSGIDGLVRLCGQDNATLNTFAGVFRMAIHQRLISKRLAATFLGSVNSYTGVAARIRNGAIQNLLSDIQFQGNQAMSGVDIFEDQARA